MPVRVGAGVGLQKGVSGPLPSLGIAGAMDAGKAESGRDGATHRTAVAHAFDLSDFSVAFPFSDVKLVSAGATVLYGCRYNLAARSPVCKRMLLSGMKEGSQLLSQVVEIPFPQMRTETLQVLLEFCTSGYFSPKRMREVPVDVIHAARYFQLTEDMEELIAGVVAGLCSKFSGNDLDMAAEILSLALQCLPPDLDAPFFEFLLRKIFSRPIETLAYAKLTPQALEFLLSKTYGAVESWAAGFSFCSSEFSIFQYLLHWAAYQISEDAQQQLYMVYEGISDDDCFDVERLVPGTSDLLDSIATIARPFLRYIDFKLIHPQDIALEIKPLKIVPAEMLLEALCHHALNLSMSTPIMYRGSHVLQWHPDAHSRDLVIDEDSDGRGIYCGPNVSGFARTVSSLRGGGEHSWIVTVSIASNAGGIGIGFCAEEGTFSEWLGHSANGWVLDGSARFWHDNMTVRAGDHMMFNSETTEVQVTVNLDRRSCQFTLKQPSQSTTLGSADGPWPDMPKVIYPAVTFCNSSGRITIRPCETTS